jgi:hypothetical protein
MPIGLAPGNFARMARIVGSGALNHTVIIKGEEVL